MTLEAIKLIDQWGSMSKMMEELGKHQNNNSFLCKDNLLIKIYNFFFN